MYRLAYRWRALCRTQKWQVWPPALEARLRSICRMLMTSNFPCEPKADEVAHNSLILPARASAVTAAGRLNPGAVRTATHRWAPVLGVRAARWEGDVEHAL